jgi:hypothetical protein
LDENDEVLWNYGRQGGHSRTDAVFAGCQYLCTDHAKLATNDGYKPFANRKSPSPLQKMKASNLTVDKNPHVECSIAILWVGQATEKLDDELGNHFNV